MASSKEYLFFILDQLSGLPEVSYRAMMGEYIIYYKDKVVGGIYDNRFLVKPTAVGREMMPDAEKETPYDGGKEMLMADNVEDGDFLCRLIRATYDELPSRLKKRSGKNTVRGDE